ncbi:Opi1-domain-containing protein [Gigaspora margarita]|uniref:Opi1-domain-containing protein n=1 Tax=Gigaspora margarita TaxID=4874 RepID=A0A8H3WW28_GIGMA|nr:Opi1-domain-containing protein [Gigaspora margarita]
MYQVLPPLSTTVGNSDCKPNGDSPEIKQEQSEGTIESNVPPTPSPSLSPTPTRTDLPSNHSRMSINQLCNDTDDEVKEAAAVLENMKQGLPPIEIPPHSTQIENDGSGQMPTSPSGETDNTLMSRSIDLLRRGMNFYEQGNYPFMKIVGSQVTKISKPVLEKLEEMMDNSSNNNNNNNNNSAVVYSSTVNGDIPYSSNGDIITGCEKDDTSNQNDSESRKRGVHGELRSSSPSYRSRSHRSSQSNGSQNSSYSHYSYSNNNYTVSPNPTTTVQRSRWQQVLVGAGTAAGAAGAAVSEESMKSLKYCLQWLTYATQHIGNQIAALKSIIDSFTSPSSSGALISQSTSKLASIKKEVVETLRKVIEVVSKYASKCLPEHARHNVRSFILSLPSRWASINHSDHSSSASPVSSPRLAPSNAHHINQSDYAHRLLSLANESLDMLRSVAGIFGETVGRAEAWVERLSSFGVTGGGANAMGPIHFDNIPSHSNGNGYVYGQATSSPPSHSPVTPRSRRTSTNSARMNRKFRTTHPLIDDDDDDDLTDSSSESDAESMRMEMDGRRVKSQNTSKSTSHSNGSLNGAKKRKKAGKKESDRMDLS